MGRMSSRFAELALVLLVAGCGGGGGGGSSIPEVPFSAFSAVQPNTTVVMSGGISATANGSYHTVGSTVVVDSVSPAVQDTAGNSTQKLTYDSNRALSGMSFTTPSGSASFNRGTGQFVCSTGVCQGVSGSSTGVVMDGTFAPLGWNYQSFGVWENATGSSFQVGAISAGIATAGPSLPTSSTANFTGIANGFYVDSFGAAYATSASMTAAVDWSTRQITFATGTIVGAETRRSNLSTGVITIDTGLNLSGTLSYAPGVNAFNGTVTTQNLQLSGPANGRFYGPAATEIGGTYSLTGSGVQRMIGGFGGRQ